MSANKSIDPRLYNPRFRFREQEIIIILAQWQDGGSVLLTGIRRTGKSELMKAALYRHAGQGQKVAYLDVQAEDSLPRFYQNLLLVLIDNLPLDLRAQFGKALDTVIKIPSGLMNWVRGQIGKVEIPLVGSAELRPADNPETEQQLLRYWKPLIEQIAILIKRQSTTESPVIGIDELPFMLENLLKKGVKADELSLMLASLRTLRDAGLRLIIGGSISFENLLTIHNIPHTTLGGLFRLPVSPFTRREAEKYLTERFNGKFAASPAAMQLTLDILPDYVPEVLKIAHGFLIACSNLAECEHSLHNQVLPGVRRTFLQQFDERLSKNYTPAELACAQAVLDLIAQGDAAGVKLDGTRLPIGYQQVIGLLQYDNFIIDAPDYSWRFSLTLIRLWWRASRGMA